MYTWMVLSNFDVHDRDLTSSPLVYMDLDAEFMSSSFWIAQAGDRRDEKRGGASISVVKSELSLSVCLTRENLCLV